MWAEGQKNPSRWGRERKREVKKEWRGVEGVGGQQQQEEDVRMINVRLSERCRGEESRPGGEKRI